jgi:hypothetical protein
VSIGPALGLPCSKGAALHVNDTEWAIADDSEALVITPKARRALPNDPIRIPKIVELLADHRCGCLHGDTALKLR